MKCTCVNKECSKEFDVDPDIKCPHCHKTQKINESLIGRLVFVCLVGIGGYQVNDLISPNFENRYPTKVEYSIINMCLNDNKLIHSDYYKKKFSKCVYALEETRAKIDYSSYKKDPGGFNKHFKRVFTNE
ncbi:hypothetical protein A9G45_11745 [Gilliamella sp. HK2]|uniref:hypothetical protein n=1 Tax=unclassified Gilliamella TaxID=2685620 RepID=UPI00080DA521|nr:hypothetical protein [Gilliamella apicola]OCG28510.1 hypothetical protein A9G46_02260 [Gilliamella apicola]OCG32529.1 hypothetical protein A9G45_11745 [Gilliamella apicola]